MRVYTGAENTPSLHFRKPYKPLAIPDVKPEIPNPEPSKRDPGVLQSPAFVSGGAEDASRFAARGWGGGGLCKTLQDFHEGFRKGLVYRSYAFVGGPALSGVIGCCIIRRLRCTTALGGWTRV